MTGESRGASDLPAGERPAAAGPVATPVAPDHELIRKIGEGGYGEVWLARSATGTFRAVKVVRRSGFDDDRPYHQEFNGIKAFEPISRTHESLAGILHVGINEVEGYFHYVMELADDARSLGGFVTGEPAGKIEFDAATYRSGTLAALLSEHRRLSFQACLDLGLAVCSGLSRLHSNDVELVHRDISPTNILFIGGRPRLGDPGTVVASMDAKSLVGTPGFIPPEGPGTIQGDIYSAGKILYVACTGLEASRCPELPLSLQGTPAWEEFLELNEIFRRACAPHPGDRYRSIIEMIEGLEALRRGRSLRQEARTRRRERRFRITIAALVALTTGVLVSNWGYRRFAQSQLESQKLQIEAGQRELALARQLIEAERRADFIRVDEEFARGNAAMGVARLAAILRQDPDNRVAATRLMSALTDRNFPLPMLPPMEHDGEVYWAEFSADGNRVVTASTDGTARIWNAQTGESAASAMRHDGQVRFACFSPDGKKIATASLDHTARIWDAATGLAASPPLRHEGWVNHARFSPDGLLAATTSKDGTVGFWETGTGKPLAMLRIGDGEVNDCQFSPDGKRVVIASHGSASVCEIATLKTTSLLAHPENVVCAVFSPDGTRIASASDNSVARLWDARTGKQIGDLMKHQAQVRTVAFSPDGGRVVTASWDETARVWDGRTGKPLTPPMKHADQMRSAVFSPDGLRVATASADFTARVWDAWSGAPLTEVIRHGNKLRGVQFSPDGVRLLTASADKTARIWDVRNGNSVLGLASQRYQIRSPEYTKDGRISAFRDGAHNVKSLVKDGILRGLIQHRDQINSTHFSGDGNWMVTGSEDNTAQVWDVRSVQPMGKPLRHQDAVLKAEFSPGGGRIVTASRDGTARLWSRSSSEALGEAMRHRGPVRGAEFSPDGSRVVTASEDRTARIWDTRNGNPTTPPMVHLDAVLFAHFSPDGRQVVTAGKDFAVRAWDARNGLPITPPLQQGAEIMFAEFSSDGKTIVTGCEDKSVRLWDARSGVLISGPMRHHHRLAHLAISPDGRHIATLTGDGVVRFWDSRLGLPLTEPRTLIPPDRWLEFSQDGRSLLAMHPDSPLELRAPPVDQVPPPWLPALAEALLGGRWTDENAFVSLAGFELWNVRSRIRSLATSGYFELCARWMFEDRSTRAITPVGGGGSTIAERVRSIMGGAVPGTPIEVLSVSPTNGLALAALAGRFREVGNPSDCHRDQALLLYDRAVEFAPEDGEVLSLVLDQALTDPVLAVHLNGFESALTVYPNSVNLWIARGCLHRLLGEQSRASQAFEKALGLVSSSNSSEKPFDANLLIDRAGLLRLAGRLAEARQASGNPENFVPRDGQSGLAQIDLSGFYNASLRRHWKDGRLQGGYILGELERGTRTLGEVRYDIRGRVLLASSHEFPREDFHPAAVHGIRVSRAGSRLHLLHGAEAASAPGTQIGHYLVSYVDGQTREIAMTYGEDVVNWTGEVEGSATVQKFRVVWESKQQTGWTGRLFQTIWPNPRPSVEISHIDFVSRLQESAPFLVAITVE